MGDHAEFFINYGVLGAFAFAVVLAVWRVSRVIGAKLFGNGDREGYVDRYFALQKEFFDGLAERDKQQIQLCKHHQKQLALMANEVVKHDENAALAISEIHEIAEIHRSGQFEHNVGHIQAELEKFRTAGLQACNLCRDLAETQEDTIKKSVATNCDAIEAMLKA
jgi:hypothetical protein